MANTIAGMFADPNSFRDERLNDLMKQRQAIGQMGGSMNQLLGQVAAGGGATGAMMAEGLGGMFGMKTAEEAKAAQLQNIAGNFDLDTSAGLASFAKQLNDMGMTKEAIMVMDKRNSVLDRERRMAAEDEKSAIDKGLREGKWRKGVPRFEMRIKTDKDGKPVLGINGQPQMERVEIPTYEIWDEAQKKYIPTDAVPTQTSGYIPPEWSKMMPNSASTKPNGTPDFATNKPATGQGPHSLANRDAATQQAMVQAYAEYVKNLPAGSVPMEMDAWFKSQQ